MKRILAPGFRAAAASLLAATTLVSAQAASPAASVSTLSGPVLSPRLSDLPQAFSAGTTQLPKLGPLPLPLPHARTAANGADPGLQNDQGLPVPIDLGSFFGGIGQNGYIPSDANIAVGKTYIVQVVNSQVAVYNKTGGLVSGPKSLSSLFSGLSGCSASNAGDPIVQYDNLADSGNGRWLISELGSTSSPFSECIAVSTTSDPTGTYYLYADTQFGSTLNDYPKFGVWPTATNSAYLATYNLFANAQTFTGAMLCAYDRTAMLNGTGALGAPRAICYTISNDGGFLPSDLDGGTPPVDGTPGYFLNFESGSSLRMYTLSPNFAGSPTGTLTQVTPDLTVDSFSEACGGGTCIAQPNGQQLDSLGDRLMYRLAYRMLGGSGGTPTMVVNHSVTAGSSVGVRWYELQNSGSGFKVAQSGTFAPDGAYRWMGSAAMDGAGDIAIGYSRSSGSLYPSVVFTGRTPSMTAGTMGTETVMQAGAGSQSCASRWGDYTSLRIDPSDDTTFWYTNEYYSSNGSIFFCNEAWKTAIGSFTIAAAPPPGPNPDFGISVSPTSITVPRGSSNTTSVTVSGINSSSSVSLSLSSAKGIGGSFNPNPVTAPVPGSNSSTLTIKANARSTRGTYIMTITGNNSYFSHTTTLSVTVQ